VEFLSIPFFSGNSLTGSDRSSTIGGQFRQGPAMVRPSVNQESLDMMEYPFLTMSKYPPGFIMHLGIAVCNIFILFMKGCNITHLFHCLPPLVPHNVHCKKPVRNSSGHRLLMYCKTQLLSPSNQMRYIEMKKTGEMKGFFCVV
jgi:hypothetical protein